MIPTTARPHGQTEPGGSTPSASRAAVRAMLAALLLAGILTDLVVRAGPASIAGTAALLAAALTVMLAGAVRHRIGWALVATAAIFASLLSLRASPWLVPLNALAAAGLLVLVASGTTTLEAIAAPPLRLLRRNARVVTGLVWAPAFLLDRVVVAFPLPAGQARDRARSIGRGLGLAIPLLAVLGGLLASADAVFASIIDLRIDGSELVARGVSVLVGIWLTSALVWLASDVDTRGEVNGDDGPRPLGAIESGLVLTALVGLFGLFVGAQALAAGASETYVLRTTGLTRAEYARSGFFQLLWAAGITLAALLGIHRFTAAEVVRRRWMRALNLAAVLLTLVVVGVAIRRLGLYEEAYGLTMLRLYSSIFAWWLGVVFVVMAIYLAWPWRRAWWAGAVLGTALGTLLVVNVVDPERLVVERNVARVAAGLPLDASYLADLSDDAVPALVAAVPRLEGDDQHRLVRAVCLAPRSERRPWYGYNRAVTRADQARALLCG